MNKETRAQEDRIEKLAGKMASYEKDFLADLTSLLEIPSSNGPATDKAPYGQATADALDAFLEMADRMGFRTKNLDYHAGYAEFGRGEKLLAVLCHLDVVPAGEGWQADPFKVRFQEGTIYARGVADDKGPAMTVLYAMKALLDQGFEPACRIRLIVGLNEEQGFGCMKHYVKVEELPDAGFTADAYFPVVFAEKGIMRISFKAERKVSGQGLDLFELSGGEAVNMVPQTCRYRLSLDGKAQDLVEVQGRSSHASRPELGDNAIVKALKAICRDNPDWDDPLALFTHRYLGQYIDGKDFGLACSDASGNLSLNLGLAEVTKDASRLVFDIRYPVTKSGQDLADLLTRAMEKVAFKREDLEINQPLDLGKDSELVQTLMGVYNRSMEVEAEAMAIGGGTYARAMPNIAAFGAVFPGTPDCMHQVDEHAKLSDLMAAMYIYRESLKALAQKLG